MSQEKKIIAFNSKVNIDGTYRKIYGWTIICMVQDDMKLLENIMRLNTIFRKHVSALPSNSYHVTVFSIHINESPLEIKSLPEMYNHLYKLAFLCQEKGWDKITLKVERVVYSGFTIVLMLSDTEEMINLKRLCLESYGVKEWLSGKYHMTLGYKYKKATKKEEEIIRKEVDMFNMMLKGQTITILAPKVCQFSDMTDFAPWKP